MSGLKASVQLSFSLDALMTRPIVIAMPDRMARQPGVRPSRDVEKAELQAQHHQRVARTMSKPFRAW